MNKNKDNKIYFCIDLKTFFASVECVERGLDPFKTNLVVADPSRGTGGICLAVSPAMKEQGVKNRCRIFEIPKNIDYITALPRMKKYIEYSAEVYGIYLKYISKDDIHQYSIDEAFLDVTKYLKLYNLTKEELANKILNSIYAELGLTATCGIGTNLYLAKIALDITAKHVRSNIAYLDEEQYRNTLWHHRPLTDFWQVGRGISSRLNKMGLFDMHDVAHCDEKRLYDEFGINAEILIDHSKGIEPVTIKEIKAYKSLSNSITQGQILFEDYNFEDARLIIKEMTDTLSLNLVDKHLVTNNVSLAIGYSKDVHKPTGGSMTMIQTTNVYSVLLSYSLELFDKTTIRNLPIRKINLSFNNVIDEAYEQLDLFTDSEKVKKERVLEETLNEIKAKFGKNSILKGINYEKASTMKKRNSLIGGHNGGEE